MNVLFDSYLRGDPTVREWAAELVDAAVADAEQHARQTHLRVLTGPFGRAGADLSADLDTVADRLGIAPETARLALDGALDTAAAACLNFEHGPFNDGICRASFLRCLECPNALVTHQHLPRLLALLDHLDARRQTMDAAAWWDRHGRAWLALTEAILPKFTPAEVAQAHTAKRAALPLDLLELLDGPGEQP